MPQLGPRAGRRLPDGGAQQPHRLLPPHLLILHGLNAKAPVTAEGWAAADCTKATPQRLCREWKSCPILSYPAPGLIPHKKCLNITAWPRTSSTPPRPSGTISTWMRAYMATADSTKDTHIARCHGEVEQAPGEHQQPPEAARLLVFVVARQPGHGECNSHHNAAERGAERERVKHKEEEERALLACGGEA